MQRRSGVSFNGAVVECLLPPVCAAAMRQSIGRWAGSNRDAVADEGDYYPPCVTRNLEGVRGTEYDQAVCLNPWHCLG